MSALRTWLLLGGYAVAFWAAHRLAGQWGGSGFYSLWFPAAGVRLALMWRMGARWTPGVMIAELAVQLVTCVVDLGNSDWPTQALGVMRPALAYGGAVALVRWATARPRSSLSTAPMPLSLASVLAPLAAVAAALPWSLWRPDITHVAGVREVVASLTGFAVGDLLGVLLVAPPLLWLADIAGGRTEWPTRWPSFLHLAEAVLVLGLSVLTVTVLARIGLGTPATPVMLAIAWIGLRFGRLASWTAIVATAALTLPETALAVLSRERIALHMSLAAVAVVGYLAGSFADAEIRARRDLERRDRMLFQAERLKTLRAMSVAVIHEISQPLSTLAIEAKHLHELSVSADPEIAASAALIDRKAAALSALVRRLRRFGGRAVDEPSLLPVSALLDTVEPLARPEAKAARVSLEVATVEPALAVMAQEVELAQALVNLVRNGIQACGPTAAVRIDAAATSDGLVGIAVSNGCTAPLPSAGMGVGSLVARAIVEAHGGQLLREDRAGLVVHHVRLPLAGDPA